METTRFTRALVYGGAAASALAAVGLAVVSLANADQPSGLAGAMPRTLALSALTLAPGALAVIGMRRGRSWPITTGALLTLALGVVSLPTGPVLWVAALLWARAVPRLPAASKARRAMGLAYGLLVSLLTVAALTAQFIHRDPACWTFLEDADGQRVHTETPADDYPSGFLRPGVDTSATGSEIGQAADGRITGSHCTSDRITPAEGAASLVLTGLAVILALRLSSATVRELDTSERLRS